jgi:hypothetical protein
MNAYIFLKLNQTNDLNMYQYMAFSVLKQSFQVIRRMSPENRIFQIFISSVWDNTVLSVLGLKFQIVLIIEKSLNIS